MKSLVKFDADMLVASGDWWDFNSPGSLGVDCVPKYLRKLILPKRILNYSEIWHIELSTESDQSFLSKNLLTMALLINHLC